MKSWSVRAQQWLIKDSLHQNIGVLAVIVFVVLLGNAVYVTGLRDSNPALQYPDLAISTSDQLIHGQNTSDPNIGYTTQALGSTAAHQLLHGHMPYWNYYEGVGSPLAGEMQSAALLPTTLLLALPGGVLLEHMLLEIIAGFFTYLFVKRLGLNAKVALLAGIMFALNGTFAWLQNAAFNPIAFLPMMLYGVETIFIRGTKSKTWMWLPIGLALSLYAGFPETAFIDLLFVALWTLAKLWQTWSDITRAQILKIGLGFTLGILLAAPILILFADYLPNANVGGHANAFAYASLGLIGLPARVFPYIYGDVHSTAWNTVVGDGGFITISIAFFAAIGLFSRMNTKLKGAIVFWIIACLLKSYGFRPAEKVWNLIPTIKNAAFYRYCVPSVEFAIIILAAYGLQGVLTKTITRARLASAYFVFSVGLIALAAIIKHYWALLVAGSEHKYFVLVSGLWAALVVGLLAATIVVVKRKYIYPIMFLIVSADVILMFFIPTFSTPKMTVDKSPVHFLQRNLGSTGRFYTLGPIQPNYGTYFNIGEVNTNDLPVPLLWTNFFTKKLDTNTDVVLFTGGYRANINGPSAFDEFLLNEKNFEYIDTKYLVTSHQQLTNSQIIASGLEEKYSDSVVDIYQLPSTTPYYQVTGNCNIYGTQDLSTVHVDCNKNGGNVVRKELFMPGWQATIDGKTVNVNEYGKLFQSINLSKGSHNVTFNFNPPYILEAWLLFGIAAVIVLYELSPEKIQSDAQAVVKRLQIRQKD